MVIKDHPWYVMIKIFTKLLSILPAQSIYLLLKTLKINGHPRMTEYCPLTMFYKKIFPKYLKIEFGPGLIHYSITEDSSRMRLGDSLKEFIANFDKLKYHELINPCWFGVNRNRKTDYHTFEDMKSI